jgi:hypothetical protein
MAYRSRSPKSTTQPNPTRGHPRRQTSRAARSFLTAFPRSPLPPPTFLHTVFAPEVIAAERPDLVIEEMVERVLSRPGFLPASELAALDAADGS